MKTAIILASACLLLASCDCVHRASGTVLDKKTGQPLAGVVLGKYGDHEDAGIYAKMDRTDTTGTFDYEAVSGGVFGCPPLTLHFFKEGYKKTEQKYACANCNDTATVYMEKIE